MKRQIQPVPQSPLKQLFESSGREIVMERRMVLAPALEPDKHVYMVMRGSLTTNAILDDNEAQLSFIKPYEIIGVDGLFDNQATKLTTVSYRPRCSAILRAIRHSDLRRYGVAQPEIYSEITSQINRQLMETSERLMEMMFDDLESRTYKALLEVAKLPDALTHPDGLQIKLTRIELALMTGSSRESAGRAIKSLSQKGLVSASGSVIVVHMERPILHVKCA